MLAQRRLAAVLAAATLLLLLPPAAALAHTGLASSTPAEGDVVEEELFHLTLVYTKAIELLDGGFVLRSDGRRVEPVEALRSADGVTVALSLAEPLSPGRWTLSWRVLASDSHPREGTVAFDVVSAEAEAAAGTDPPPAGGRTQPPAADAPTEAPAGPSEATRRSLEVLSTIARILMYLGLMSAAGLAFFKAGPHRGEDAHADLLARTAALAAVVALAASTIEVAVHVAAVSGRGLAGMLHAPTWRAVFRTGLGTAFWLRTLGLGLLALGGYRRARLALPSAPDPAKLLGALLVIASFQFVGHTASAVPPPIVRTADAIHAVAAAVWVGGLVGLGLLGLRRDTESKPRAAARFSTAATYSVVGVAIAGSALAWVNLPELAALWTTGYGQVLLVKLALVTILGTLGAWNHFHVVPRVVAGEEGALGDLRHKVRTEILLMLAILALTAVLVNLSPQ